MANSSRSRNSAFVGVLGLVGSCSLGACANTSMPSVTEQCFAVEASYVMWVPSHDGAMPPVDQPAEISRFIPSELMFSSQPGRDIFGEPVEAESPYRRIVGLRWGEAGPVRFFREVWRQDNDRLFMEWTSGFVSYVGNFQWLPSRQAWEGVIVEVEDYQWEYGSWTSSTQLSQIECPAG